MKEENLHRSFWIYLGIVSVLVWLSQCLGDKQEFTDVPLKNREKFANFRNVKDPNIPDTIRYGFGTLANPSEEIIIIAPEESPQFDISKYQRTMMQQFTKANIGNQLPIFKAEQFIPAPE